MSLAYYVEDQNEFKSIYQYSRFAIDPEEIIAHQLCEFHIIEGHLYELRSNEMDGEYDQLIVDHVEASPVIQRTVSIRRTRFISSSGASRQAVHIPSSRQ
ncbi:hypothetical protein [Exiguobacterium artemiae]